MHMLRGSTQPVHRETAADDWPTWTDEATWELGPDADDARWWADQNESWHADDEPPDSYWDERAAESEAQNRIERGICL